ncbi:MAG TPA: cobalamin-dependent protein, partial [Rhodocyclaceae bacterium]|nr:cobalamin-dependent protein [Rhodocyclaceae bacterium]
MDRSDCKILLLNPPAAAIGGLLQEAGFPVEVLETDIPSQLPAGIVARVAAAAPRIVMVGRADATSAHPAIAELIRLIKAALPAVAIVYSGAFPAYHWRS